MALNEELKIVINGDASGANKAFNSLTSSMKNIGPKLIQLGKIAMVGIAALATAAAAGIATVLKKAFDNWTDNQLIQTKLNNTLKNTGKITGVTTDLVNKLGKELQKTTRFEDDMVAAGGEILARFKTINSNIFPETIKLTADLAESLGVDFPEAAKMMGKALSTPGEGLRVLKQAGVDLGDDVLASIDKLLASGKLEEAQKLILAALSGSVGGVAVEAGKTGSGMADRMKNQMGGIFDTLGEKMGPGFEKTMSFLETSLSQLTSDPAFINMITVLGTEFTKLADKLPMIVGKIREFFDSIGLDQTTVINGITTGIQIFGMAVNILFELFSKFVAMINPAKQTLKDLWAIFQMLGTYLQIQLKKAFQTIMESKFVTGARALFAGIGSAIQGIVSAIKSVMEWFAKLPAAIPAWLIPGSPTPFEMGLRGISSELDNISKATLPNLTGGVSMSTGGADNRAASEMAGIRDEIRFLVRTLPRAIANANA
jgi:hypothetical protein